MNIECIKNLFAYFLLLYRYAFFLTNKCKCYQKIRKKRFIYTLKRD